MNQGIHTVDLLLYLLGRGGARLRPDRDARARIEAEDTAAAPIEFESGASPRSRRQPRHFGQPRRIQIAGSGGRFLDGDGLQDEGPRSQPGHSPENAGSPWSRTSGASADYRGLRSRLRRDRRRPVTVARAAVASRWWKLSIARALETGSDPCSTTDGCAETAVSQRSAFGFFQRGSAGSHLVKIDAPGVFADRRSLTSRRRAAESSGRRRRESPSRSRRGGRRGGARPRPPDVLRRAPARSGTRPSAMRRSYFLDPGGHVGRDDAGPHLVDRDAVRREARAKSLTAIARPPC